MLLSCGVGEDSWESLGLQGEQTVNPKRKSILNIHWRDWYWSWSFNNFATWCEEPTHLKRPWCWEDWRQKEKGAAEDEMVRYRHRINGHEFEQLLGDSGGQTSLVCFSLWGHKELDMTEWFSTQNLFFKNTQDYKLHVWKLSAQKHIFILYNVPVF